MLNTEIEYINVEKELDKFFKSVIKQSKQNLVSGGHNASKTLYRGMDYDVKVSKNSIDADFLMPKTQGSSIPYAEFLNYGVKGVKSGKSLKGYKYTNKKPPVRFIRTWLKQKTGKFRSRDLTKKAYAIQNTIYQKGVKPTEFFSKPFEKEFNKLPDAIIEAYGLDLDNFMEFVLNK